MMKVSRWTLWMIKQNIGSHTKLDQLWDWNITEKWFSIHKPSSIYHPACVAGQVLVNFISPAGVRTDTLAGDPDRASAASPSTCRVSGTTIPGSSRPSGADESGCSLTPLLWNARKSRDWRVSVVCGPPNVVVLLQNRATNTHHDQSINQAAFMGKESIIHIAASWSCMIGSQLALGMGISLSVMEQATELIT